MDCYVVLWIPTIVYDDFSKPLRNSLEKNISDIPGKELVVRLDLSREGDFSVYTKNGEHFDLLVKLKKEQISSNGLMMFSYSSTSVKENGFRFTSTEFPTAIYHMLKEFYHVHDFHDNDSDSSLAPFVSSVKIDIQENDNEALKHYLIAYSKVISNTSNYIRFLSRRVRINKKGFDFQTRGMIQKLCLYARGYEVYMGVLYHSKYNTICNVDSDDRGWRHHACNINNGLNYIRIIEREHGLYIQQAFVDKVINDAAESVKMARKSNWFGLVSIIIGIISLVVALVIASKSTKELNDVKDSIEQEIEIIPASLSETESKIQELKAEQDSLHAIDINTQEQIQSVSKKVDDLFWVIRKMSE